MSQLARDNASGKSTGYDYLHEGIDVLATRAPSLRGALLAASPNTPTASLALTRRVATMREATLRGCGAAPVRGKELPTSLGEDLGFPPLVDLRIPSA